MYLSRADCKRILKLYAEGWGYRSIHRITGFSERSIENLLQGKTHRDVTGGRVCNGKRPGRELAIYRKE